MRPAGGTNSVLPRFVARATVPITTANWDTGGEKWTLPVGAQVGRVIKLGGKLPVKLGAGVYYNALRPTGTGTWQLLTEAALVF
jgi:hypothetical protein